MRRFHSLLLLLLVGLSSQTVHRPSETMLVSRTKSLPDVEDATNASSTASLLQSKTDGDASTSSFNQDCVSDVKPVDDVPSSSAPIVSSLGLKVLVLLAVQNCSKNLLMRFVMKEKPEFLTSAAILGVELVKLILCVMYILFVDKRPISTIWNFLRDDSKHALLLSIPAAAYSFQMSMEYVALANLDAAIFSVLVQTKLLTTASFSTVFLRKKFKYIQIISLLLLTVGVMLINTNHTAGSTEEEGMSSSTKGVLATLGIALSSGFASVYTEMVLKAQRNHKVTSENYSLAYMQVQLALVSLVIMGLYAMVIDFKDIREHGLWHNFTPGAFVSVFNSAIGGLVVAATLKYADSVLKSYATAISVVLTGVLSMLLFGTKLDVIYFMGIINVVCAVLLYNGKNLDQYACAP